MILRALILVFSLAMPISGFAADPIPAATPTPLDANLKSGTDDEVSSVFRDMGVVQRKAMNKRRRFVVSSFTTLDFSDGPYTNYALNVNPGYAFSDFFEVYLQLTPYYIVSKRSIVDYVESLQLSNNEQARLTSAKPKYQYGIEFLWAPLYGKDSFGVSKILRSDTFFKFGASQIQYDSTRGLGFKAGVGKTFFLGNSIGFRFCVDYGYIQGVINDTKAFKGMMLLETGVSIYL
jgi:outer membrane beta-barrel protein